MFLESNFHINCHNPYTVPFHIINKKYDVFSYGSKERTMWKIRNKLRYFVQDHHCIPYQFRNHALIKIINFDVNCSKNIFMMPNKHAINNIILPYGDTTLLHDGGHPKFNSWVGKQLDNIYKSSDDLDSKKYEFWLLLNFIRENMNINQDNIPWE